MRCLTFQLNQKSYDLICAHDELFSTGKANEELKAIINSHIEQSSKSIDEGGLFDESIVVLLSLQRTVNLVLGLTVKTVIETHPH